ncbi:MAG TPA: hypothetical protein DEQ50_02670 [Lactobacillus sp.]|nr:hypothetical protein [Lactobacillus sp.]
MKTNPWINVLWVILVPLPWFIVVSWTYFVRPSIGNYGKFIPPIVAAIVLVFEIRAFVKGYGRGDDK